MFLSQGTEWRVRVGTMNGGGWFNEGLQGLTTLDSGLVDVTSKLSRVCEHRSVPHNMMMREYSRAFRIPRLSLKRLTWHI